MDLLPSRNGDMGDKAVGEAGIIEAVSTAIDRNILISTKYLHPQSSCIVNLNYERLVVATSPGATGSDALRKRRTVSTVIPTIGIGGINGESARNRYVVTPASCASGRPLRIEE